MRMSWRLAVLLCCCGLARAAVVDIDGVEEEEDGEARTVFTSGGTYYIALNTTYLLYYSLLLGTTVHFTLLSHCSTEYTALSAARQAGSSWAGCCSAQHSAARRPSPGTASGTARTGTSTSSRGASRSSSSPAPGATLRALLTSSTCSPRPSTNTRSMRLTGASYMLPVSPARRRGTARTAPSPRPCSTS